MQLFLTENDIFGVQINTYSHDTLNNSCSTTGIDSLPDLYCTAPFKYGTRQPTNNKKMELFV